ncbi:integrase [Pelagibius sp. Alg239-R121]|uniref:integrase n=1 Tax=Pelagibius sp. Alg239-R121 TaxID=2993448 RepID=UPI0024A715CE|nr:integrase [Pelagibius sp. Alg239-R121]
MSKTTARPWSARRIPQAARDGIPLAVAMQQPQHKSLQQTSQQHNDAEAELSRAARLMG